MRISTLGSVAVCLGSFALACEAPLALSDFADQLTDDPEEGYEQPGRELAPGRFQELSFEPAPPTLDFALALGERGGLLIHSITTGDECTLPGVSRYWPAVWNSIDLDVAQPRVPVVLEEGGVLAFSDFDCRLGRVRVEAPVLPPESFVASEFGVEVRTEEERLLLANPWDDTVTDLGYPLLAKEDPFSSLLFAKDGSVRIYDWAYQTIFEMEQEAVEGLLFGVLGGTLLLRTPDGDLLRVNPQLADPSLEPIDTDVCGLSRAGSLALYFSPCDERRLILWDSLTERRHEFASGVEAPRLVERSLNLGLGVDPEQNPAVVFFRDLDPDTEVGELWAQRVNEPEVRLLDRAYDRWMFPAYREPGDTTAEGGSVLAFVLTPGKQPSAIDLLAVDGTKRVTLATDLLQLYQNPRSLFLIGEGDDERGDLIVLESEGGTGVVLRVPEILLSQAIAGVKIRREPVLREVVAEPREILLYQRTERRVALFRTGEDQGHELYLITQARLDGAFEEPERIADNVGRDYSFSWNLEDTVVYLTDGAEHSPQLRLVDLRSKRNPLIANSVSEYEEVLFDGRQGILYARAGAEPGLWFSELR